MWMLTRLVCRAERRNNTGQNANQKDRTASHDQLFTAGSNSKYRRKISQPMFCYWYVMLEDMYW